MPTHKGIAKLSWSGWLVTYWDNVWCQELNPDMVTHPSTNWAWQVNFNDRDQSATSMPDHHGKLNPFRSQQNANHSYNDNYVCYLFEGLHSGSDWEHADSVVCCNVGTQQVNSETAIIGLLTFTWPVLVTLPLHTHNNTTLSSSLPTITEWHITHYRWRRKDKRLDVYGKKWSNGTAS